MIVYRPYEPARPGARIGSLLSFWTRMLWQLADRIVFPRSEAKLRCSLIVYRSF